MQDLCQPFGPRKYFFAQDKQQEADLWTARKEALWTMTSIKPENYSIWSTDVAVPISRLAEIISSSPLQSRFRTATPLTMLASLAKSKEDSSKLGLFASVIGHVGDGNFHLSVTYETGNEEQIAAVGRCVHVMMDRALEMEGTVSVGFLSFPLPPLGNSTPISN